MSRTQMPGPSGPVGPAGGGLTGTYPNPGISASAAGPWQVSQPPAVANALDDEFTSPLTYTAGTPGTGGAGSAAKINNWSILLGSLASATVTFDNPTWTSPLDPTLTVGSVYNISGTGGPSSYTSDRPSNLLIQPGSGSAAYESIFFNQAVTFATNCLLELGGSVQPQSTAANIGLVLSDVQFGATFNNIQLYFDGVNGTMSASTGGGAHVYTQSVSWTGTVGSIVAVRLLKKGSTYYGFMLTSEGTYQLVGSFADPATTTFAYLDLAARNTAPVAPGATILGFDWFRYSTQTWR